MARNRPHGRRQEHDPGHTEFSLGIVNVPDTAALNLPRSATATAWEVFRDYGNMSSPTVLFIIDKLRQARAPRPCVAIGFGPGLTAEVALWQ